MVEKIAEVSALRKQLEGLTEDGRFDSWMQIYSETDSSTSYFIDQIYTDSDPVLKIWLIRFLARIPEERSVCYLVKMLEDPNSIIFEAAKNALQRNGFEKKWNQLIALIDSKIQRAQFYAIEKLSQSVDLSALISFLQMLSNADEALLIHLLKGLRYYADERVLQPVLPYLKDEREEVRFRTVLIMGTLYEGEVLGAYKPFMKSLKDTSPKVRRAILWDLRRTPNKKDLKVILQVAKSDPDPLVRQEAFSYLSFFPEEKVIYFLLKILASEKEKILLLKAEGVLNGFPPGCLSKALWKRIRGNKGPQHDKALLFLAEMSDADNRCVNYLIKKIKQTKKPKGVVPLLENLGVAENPMGIPVLESYLSGNPILAYTAIGALLKIWRRHPESIPIQQYLEDPNITPLNKQTILKQMLKMGKGAFSLKKTESILIPLLDSENLNIRYLSSQVLDLNTTEQTMTSLFHLGLWETDPACTRFLQESIQRQMTSNPEWVGILLQNYRENEDAVRYILAILQEVKLFGGDLVSLLGSIMAPPLLLHKSEYKNLLKNLIASLLFQRKLSLELFFEEIKAVSGRKLVLQILRDILKSYPEQDIKIPIDYLKVWFDDNEDLESQEVIIDLFLLSRDQQAISTLTAFLCKTEEGSMQKYAAAGLAQLVAHSEEKR